MAFKFRRHVLDLYGVVLWQATTEQQWFQLGSDHPDGSLPSPPGAGMTVAGEYAGVFEVAVFVRVEECDQRYAMRVAVHEAVHAAGAILDHIGQRDTDDRGSEAMAYLTEWLAQWLWQGIDRHYR